MKIDKLLFYFIYPFSIILLWAFSYKFIYFETLIGLIVDFLNYPEFAKTKIITLLQNDLQHLQSGYNLFFYSFFLMIVFFLVIYVKYKKQNLILLFIISLIIFYPLINIFNNSIWMRRLYFMIIILPFVTYFWSFVNKIIDQLSKNKNFKNLLKFLSAIFILIITIPGFYFPPFFDGISGWTNKQNPNNYEIKGIKINFKDNTAVWFRPSFYNPITQDSRANRIIKIRNYKFYKDEYFFFLKNLYTKIYPDLKKHNLGTQKILGKYSYLPHNIDFFDEREKYQPPKNITSFVEVMITFDGEKRIRQESILNKWIVPLN